MLLAVLLSACLKTDIPELKVDFECPEKVMEVRVSGDHTLLEEFIRIDVDRSELKGYVPTAMHESAVHTEGAMQTSRAMFAAIAAFHWINKKFPIKELSYTEEDRNGKYICTMRVEAAEEGTVHVTEGDCAGAGKK